MPDIGGAVTAHRDGDGQIEQDLRRAVHSARTPPGTHARREWPALRFAFRVNNAGTIVGWVTMADYYSMRAVMWPGSK